MITVELYGPALAIVTTTPSLLRRILFRAQATERYAVRLPSITGGYRWTYDAGDPVVEPAVLAAIELEVRRARRPRTFAAEPPG